MRYNGHKHFAAAFEQTKHGRFSCRAATAFSANSLRSKVRFVKLKLADFEWAFDQRVLKNSLADFAKISVHGVAIHANNRCCCSGRQVLAKTAKKFIQFLCT